jgi:hypothetical protein
MPRARAASMSLTSSPVDVVNSAADAHRLMTALIFAALPNNGAPVPNWSIIDATSAPSTRRILALVLELTIAIEMPRLWSAAKKIRNPGEYADLLDITCRDLAQLPDDERQFPGGNAEIGEDFSAGTAAEHFALFGRDFAKSIVPRKFVQRVAEPRGTVGDGAVEIENGEVAVSHAGLAHWRKFWAEVLNGRARLAQRERGNATAVHGVQ